MFLMAYLFRLPDIPYMSAVDDPPKVVGGNSKTKGEWKGKGKEKLDTQHRHG